LRYRENIIILTIFLFLLSASFARAATFNLIDVPGAVYTFPHDINNREEVVGYFIYADGEKHGFLFSKGRFTTIDFPDALWTEAWGINDAGEIVGAYQDSATGVIHGFLRSKGAFSIIDYPGAQFTKAVGINNDGQIVGFYDEASSFLLSQGEFSNVAVPGADLTIAQGINDSGEIVGLWRKGNITKIFLFTQNKFQRPLVPSYVKESSAYGIDNRGQIIGVYIDREGLGRGFLLSGHHFVSLYLPSTMAGISVFGLNDQGAVVGIVCEQGNCNGFMLSVSIPSTRMVRKPAYPLRY
jgi:probable HAF family extracellular repeat protein